jgi:hypothetical protein
MRVTYWHPALMPLWMNHFRKSGVSFKIYLVHRDRKVPEARIVRTWEITPAQVQWKPPRKDDLLYPVTTASLVYDQAQKRATVTITGIDRDITAHVDIEDARR